MNTTGNNYSYWYSNQKANGYQNDMPGYARQQSAAVWLSIAMVRDDPNFFIERSLPSIEFMASRKDHIIKLDGGEDDMGGPTGSATDWCSLNVMSGKKCYVFRRFAEEMGGDLKNAVNPNATYTRQQALDNAKMLDELVATYRMTGDAYYLTEARKAADDYIYWRLEREQPDFYGTGGFWAQVGPMWNYLELIYDETKDVNYITGAAAAMEEFTEFINFTPVVPDGNITVNNETVPAWRVAEAGMIEESIGSCSSHRGISMAPHAGNLSRLAHYSGDTFFRDISRSAIIGRYANYPGYAYRNYYTTEYEKPDYPLKSYEDYNNTAHFNHPAPMCTYMIDYMVSDVFYRSNGNITFPSQYTSTGGYFEGKVYGDRPGSFYGEPNVWLWLPKGLISMNNIQINYIAGYGNGKLYLALSNQSTTSLSVTVTLNSSLVPYGTSNTARLWKENVRDVNATVTNGQVTVDIAAKGITAIAIDNINITTKFQSKYANDTSDAVSTGSYGETMTSYGKVAGMIIKLSRQLTSAYVYTDADCISDLNSATLHYSTNKGSSWNTSTDSLYPFEFTVSLPDANVSEFRFYVEGVKSGGSYINSSTVILDIYSDCAFIDRLADTSEDISTTPVLRWFAGTKAASHNVYFGTSFADVNSATTASAAFKNNQSATAYPTGTLNPNTTYYWRIDEVNSTTVWRGTVWSFRTRVANPSLISSAGFTATASDTYTGRDPLYAVNGAGMTGNAHNSDAANSKMWMGANSTLSKWFKVNLGASYVLDFMDIWNLNWAGYTDRGSKGIMVYYSNSVSDPGNPIDNPDNWTFVTTAMPWTLLEAPGANDYGTTNIIRPDVVSFGSTVTARWVALKITTYYGGSYCGLSEIRFYKRTLPGDFNHDGKVDIKDIATLALHWLEDGHVGQNCPQIPTGDLNDDCRVNFIDFAIMALDWL